MRVKWSIYLTSCDPESSNHMTILLIDVVNKTLKVKCDILYTSCPVVCEIHEGLTSQCPRGLPHTTQATSIVSDFFSSL